MKIIWMAATAAAWVAASAKSLPLESGEIDLGVGRYLIEDSENTDSERKIFYYYPEGTEIVRINGVPSFDYAPQAEGQSVVKFTLKWTPPVWLQQEEDAVKQQLANTFATTPEQIEIVPVGVSGANFEWFGDQDVFSKDPLFPPENIYSRAPMSFILHFNEVGNLAFRRDVIHGIGAISMMSGSVRYASYENDQMQIITHPRRLPIQIQVPPCALTVFGCEF